MATLEAFSTFEKGTKMLSCMGVEQEITSALKASITVSAIERVLAQASQRPVAPPEVFVQTVLKTARFQAALTKQAGSCPQRCQRLPASRTGFVPNVQP